MEKWQPSTLSWSFSRKTHFDSCRRFYFYNRFWGQDPKLKWRLFTMRSITTLMMLRGAVVHEVIANALESVREGKTPDVEAVKRRVTEIMREKYMESYHRLWEYDNRLPGRKLSSITNLLEHFYNFPDVMEQARVARQVAWSAIENLMNSEFWREVTGADPESWREVEAEGFPSFDLDGIMVYTRIDFAHSQDQPTIIDWKTGQQTETDRKQLTLYSLYAESKWGWKPTETRLAAVYLQPELTIDSFSPTGEEIDAVTQEVKQNFAQMVELEPAYGLAQIDDFPLTEDISNCRYCRFQGICEGAVRLQNVT